jgi:hypothetical protein
MTRGSKKLFPKVRFTGQQSMRRKVEVLCCSVALPWHRVSDGIRDGPASWMNAPCCHGDLTKRQKKWPPSKIKAADVPATDLLLPQ